MKWQVNTKVYKSKTGEFVGDGTASLEADSKKDAKFLIGHGIILANTPEGYRVVPDVRTLKPYAGMKKDA